MSFDPNNEVSEGGQDSFSPGSMAFTMIRAARSVDSTIRRVGCVDGRWPGRRLDRYLDF